MTITMKYPLIVMKITMKYPRNCYENRNEYPVIVMKS